MRFYLALMSFFLKSPSRRRNLKSLARYFLALMALVVIYSAIFHYLMVLALLNMLNPYVILIISFFSGLVQSSDILMRNSLIGDSIPTNMIMNASSFAKIAQDGARLIGALTGASLFSALGLGVAYIFVVIINFFSVLLTMGVSAAHPRFDGADKSLKPQESLSQLKELRDGFSYIWNSPAVLAIISLAFLANLTAFPISHGLMPFIAKEVLLTDENGLGHLLAAFSLGSLLGSFILAWTISQKYSNKIMMIGMITWYVMLAMLALAQSKEIALLILAKSAVI